MGRSASGGQRRDRRRDRASDNFERSDYDTTRGYDKHGRRATVVSRLGDSFDNVANSKGGISMRTCIAIIIILAVVAALVMSTIALISADGNSSLMSGSVVAAKSTLGSPLPFSLGANAQKLEDGSYYIGEGSCGGKRVKGYAHMLYASDFEDNEKTKTKTKAPRRRGRGRGVPEEFPDEPVNGGGNAITPCVIPFAAGAKWKAPATIIIDPTNTQGIDHGYFERTVRCAFAQWDARLATPIIAGQDGSRGCDGIDFNSPDSKNEVCLGRISEPGVLAVTVVWMIADGPTAGREILEADILFAHQWNWGDALTDSTFYDMYNTATHEVGHWLGFNHRNLASITMAPTASRGETEKRDPHACEVQGLCNFYGEPACVFGSGNGTLPGAWGTRNSCGLPDGNGPASPAPPPSTTTTTGPSNDGTSGTGIIYIPAGNNGGFKLATPSLFAFVLGVVLLSDMF